MVSGPPDEELYARWVSGDKKAGEALIARCIDPIYRFFLNKTATEEDASDLVATVFEIVTQKLGTFENKSRFRTYLFGIATNVLRDYVKRRVRRDGKQVDLHESSINELGPTASAILDERTELKVLKQALRRLPIECQIAIELAYFERMTHPEIAETLSEPVGTIASRIYRGKKLLHRLIDEEARELARAESTSTGFEGWMAAIRKALREAGLHEEEDDDEPPA